ncbi:hypothetical protein [Legionella cincinnatiensis]|uniref:Uncharacterized protein n=1 Tax=Legionella cincinnatiensis TaxID=28085 RepID=A0A378ITJ8_9GAMM|nr:hypothetical protein [Legionella cincinnatiensis]KTC78743.1 hypothetical protein Lcin_3358 [Legionella cincinnatiensis]STX35334.1 Uncharacterised protein [Legionella cincinnatiensis]
MKTKFENLMKAFNAEFDNSGVSVSEDYNPTLKESTKELLYIMSSVPHQPSSEREFRCKNREDLHVHAKGKETPVTGVNAKLDDRGIKLSKNERDCFKAQVDDYSKYGHESEKGRIYSTAHEQVIADTVRDEKNKLIAKANRLEEDGLMKPAQRDAYKTSINSHHAGEFAHRVFGVAKNVFLCKTTAAGDHSVFNVGEITESLVDATLEQINRKKEANCSQTKLLREKLISEKGLDADTSSPTLKTIKP